MTKKRYSEPIRPFKFSVLSFRIMTVHSTLHSAQWSPLDS